MTACLTASHGSEWPPPSAAAHNTAPPSPRSQLEEKRAAAKGTATALTCFIGAVQAGAIAAGLLVFTAKVDAIVNTASLPTGYTVRGGGGGFTASRQADAARRPLQYGAGAKSHQRSTRSHRGGSPGRPRGPGVQHRRLSRPVPRPRVPCRRRRPTRWQ